MEHEYYARGLEPMRGHLCERSIPCHHFKGKPMQRRTCEREEANVRTRHTFTEREGAWLGIELLLAALQVLLDHSHIDEGMNMTPLILGN